MTARVTRPSWSADLPLSDLDESEAGEAIEKLNRGELTSDNIPETVRSGWPPIKDGL